MNVPCSHAAHYESPTSRSYRDSWTADIHHNYQRVAEVWLGPYKKYFYDNFPYLEVGYHSDKNMRAEIYMTVDGCLFCYFNCIGKRSRTNWRATITDFNILQC